jgi:hypothetical protein
MVGIDVESGGAVASSSQLQPPVLSTATATVAPFLTAIMAPLLIATVTPLLTANSGTITERTSCGARSEAPLSTPPAH